MRRVINFNGGWLFSKAGEDPIPVTLPHTWNAQDGQDGGNDYWRGTATYVKSFPRPEYECGERVWIEFAGVAMTAEVTLNGTKLVRHEGGYSAFRADITDALGTENTLFVTVDNSENDRVYPQKADFTFYGGIYRDVKLIRVPAEHFALGFCGTPGIKVTPVVDLDQNIALVTVETWHNAKSVEITVNGETKRVEKEAVFTIENPRLWDGLADPHLYIASARLSSGDEVHARFGCRVFAMDAQRGFLLNGRAYPLRGVSRHQDIFGKGNALSLADHKADMEIVRELGANTLRLAHYQHAQEFYDLCDEAGIVVWAEIPYITQHMEHGRENTFSQMKELIVQCYNHPSIAVWGLSNEITVSGMSEDLMENHRLLNEVCHRLDPTRKTVMAHAFMLEQDSPLLEIPDINSYNLYFGWYLGELSQNDEFFDEYRRRFPDRVIGFSEYGADANPQFQTSHPEQGDYSETYQCVYHEHLLQCIEARPYLWATHVWNLFDFAADGRDEGGRHGINQKGLVTFDRKLKKDAFYLYKAAWNKNEPFVHLCGRRYLDRPKDVAEVKVYSNQSSVTLMVDDLEFETKTGERIFTFSVPITGEHKIEACSGACRDAITVRKAEEPNPAYALGSTRSVTNWFDEDDFDSACYSIRDSLGALMANAETAQIVERVMAKARATRGDVAEAASENANLQKMMAKMSLEILLKKAGDAVSPEAAKQLNDALQKVKK